MLRPLAYLIAGIAFLALCVVVGHTLVRIDVWREHRRQRQRAIQRLSETTPPAQNVTRYRYWHREDDHAA